MIAPYSLDGYAGECVMFWCALKCVRSLVSIDE